MLIVNSLIPHAHSRLFFGKVYLNLELFLKVNVGNEAEIVLNLAKVKCRCGCQRYLKRNSLLQAIIFQ